MDKTYLFSINSNDRGSQPIESFSVDLKRVYRRVKKFSLLNVILPNVGNINNLGTLYIKCFPDSKYYNILSSKERNIEYNFCIHPVFDSSAPFLDSKILGKGVLDMYNDNINLDKIEISLYDYTGQLFNFNSVITNSTNNLHNITFIFEVTLQ